ncbi:MAG: hypothetical protein ACKVRP_13100 [Bacteroidota bacterium]
MNTHFIRHSFLLYFCIASSVSAQTDSSWKKIGTVDGRITQIEFHPSGAWFLIARKDGPFKNGKNIERNFLYRSTDGGNMWKQLADTHFIWPFKQRGNVLCIHPSGTVLISAANTEAILNDEKPKKQEKGVYCSTDLGETWTKARKGSTDGFELLSDGSIMTRPMAGPKTLSVDGGLTWEDFPYPNLPDCIDEDDMTAGPFSMAGSFTKTLFLTCSNSQKVWRSTDRGHSWLESINEGYLPHITSAGMPVFTKYLLRNPPNSGQNSSSEGHAEFWASTDEGIHWNRSDTAYQNINWRYGKIVNGDNNALYSCLGYMSGKSFVLQKTTDLGRSWTTVSEIFPRSGGLTTFAFHPDGRLVLGTLDGEIYTLKEQFEE